MILEGKGLQGLEEMKTKGAALGKGKEEMWEGEGQEERGGEEKEKGALISLMMLSRQGEQKGGK